MEYHLFLIWQSGLDKLNPILEEIRINFEIVELKKLKWLENIKYKAISRLYKSSTIKRFSGKVSRNGDNHFICIIVKDHNPSHKLKRNINGKIAWVNENVSTVKSHLRNLYNQNIIHSTDNLQEFYHQYLILFGSTIVDSQKLSNMSVSKDDYEISYPVNFDGFNSLKDFYSFLNIYDKYLVINSPSCDKNNYTILVKEKIFSESIIGFEKKDNFCYKVRINNNLVDFKILDENDRLIDNRWIQKMLAERSFDGEKYYMDETNMFFMDIYLNLLNKKIKKILKISLELFTNIEMINFDKKKFIWSKKYRLSLLQGYLSENNFNIYSMSFLNVLKLYDLDNNIVCENILCLTALKLKYTYLIIKKYIRIFLKLS